MAMTKTHVGRSVNGNPVYRYTETGAANTLLTASAVPAVPFRFLSSHVAYSAAPTQAGVTTTLNSGAGAGFDTTLNTGTANARYTTYQPNEGGLHFGDDDSVDVTAPAGGVGVTASVSVYIEEWQRKEFSLRPSIQP